MKLKYKIRQRRPYRTRLQFHGLRNNPQFCAKLEGYLSGLEGVVSADVRPASGSIILCHPKRYIPVDEIVSLVRSEAVTAFAGHLELPPGAKKTFPLATATHVKQETVYHISGFSLIVSGAYLTYLYLKRVSLFTLVTPIAALWSLPVMATFVLSLPIQRQAIDNFKESGKPDMGMISTGLLYLSLVTGSVLSSYTVFWLFNLSGWLESKIKTRTRQTIRDMFSAKANTAWLLVEGTEVETAVADLRVDDIIVLRFGCSIPVDGVIIDGGVLINESTLTGESVPAHKAAGDFVLAGTIIEDGEIRVRVEKTGEETRLAAIVRLIENAENEPGDLQLTSRRFSQLMVPVALSLAGAVFFFTGNLVQAMAVLIITCPCSLRLSTSVAISSAMARAAEEGILVKGGRFIETAGKVNVLVVDKTGTLTHTRSSKVEVSIFDRRYQERTLIQLAASTQKIWPHPVGQCILDKAKELGTELLTCSDAKFFVGRGIRATINGKEIVFGSMDFLEELGLERVARDKSSLGSDCTNGQLYLVKEGKLLAGFMAHQNVRADVEEAIFRLRKSGVNDLILLSGDVQSGTEELGDKLGFDRVLWQQSPEDKAYWINKYREENSGKVIAMVGDGVNDTPAFAASDLSISIADGGSDITVEYSDVVLQSGGLEKVADLVELGRSTDETLKRSYSIAIGLNLLTLAGTSFGYIVPVVGALFHNLITLLAVGNATNIRIGTLSKSDQKDKKTPAEIKIG